MTSGSRRVALLVAILLGLVLTVGGAARSLALRGRLPEPMPNAMAEANVHLQQGRWREAAGQYETVVTIAPGNRTAWFYLAVALVNLGDEEGLARAHRMAQRSEASMAVAVQQGARAARQWRALDPAQRARIHRGDQR